MALIFKYKAIEASMKRAEYFVNVSYDSLGIFPDSNDKKILQNLTSFSLNRSFKDTTIFFSTFHSLLRRVISHVFFLLHLTKILFPLE